MNASESLEVLKGLAINLGVYELCSSLLNNPRFPVWSGSGRPTQHHYGDGGLVVHTAEVVTLCLNNNKTLRAGIDEKKLFCAALFHDSGKMWDYQRSTDPEIPWEGSSHKRLIHHISRSALIWQEASHSYYDHSPAIGRPLRVKYDWLTDEVVDEVLHAILAHHGLREWGSPVMPKTRLAWMLHLCDNLSARINDADKWDHVK